MASRTQLRLGQITGSFGTNAIIDSQAVSSAANLAAYNATSGSMVGVMSDIASALLRIHGGNTFAGGDVGTLKDIDGNTRITYVADGKLLLSGSGTGSDAVDIDAPRGGFSIDGVQASNITVTSAGAADDLTITQAGANDSSIIITAAGTGTDAIRLDATAGSMLIGNSLADGKTLKLGNNASTEMVFTPSSTAGNEKISLINKAGTADNAILIDSEAGGVTIAAGNDSLVLDADGTDADAINVDSAGGVDVDAVGDIALNSSAKVTLSGSSGVDSVHIESALKVTGAAIFDNNVTISGNLDIEGTTTTIDTANLAIKDSIIALGVSGSDGGYSTTGDRGILFTRGTDSSFNNGLFWDGTDFKFAVTNTGPNSGSFADPANAAAYSTVRVGKLNSENETDATSTTDGALQTDGGLSVKLDAVIGNDLHLLSNAAVLNLGADQKFTLTHANASNTALVTSNNRLAFGSADEYIAGDGNDLSIFSGRVLTLDAETDIVLDAKGNDIFLKDNGQIFTTFTNGSNSALVLSGGFAGGNIHLDANGGVIALQKGGSNLNAIEVESTGLKIGLFDGASGNFNAGFLQLKDSGGNPSILSGTVGLRLDVGGDAASLQLMTNNADRFVALQAPDGVTDNVTFKLPAEDGSANQVLITNGSAALSFASAASAADTRKGIFIMTASIAAGTAVGTDHGQDLASDAITFSGVTAIQGRVVDVFVNGQLLTSGSATERASVTAGADYEIASTKTLKFAFALEEDDIIQVVKRG